MLDFTDLLKKADSRVAAWFMAKTARTSAVQGYSTTFLRDRRRASPVARRWLVRAALDVRSYRNLPFDASRGKGRKVPLLVILPLLVKASGGH